MNVAGASNNHYIVIIEESFKFVPSLYLSYILLGHSTE